SRSWKNLDLTLVSLSRWLAQKAGESRLFSQRRIEVIPNSLDTDIYKPLDKDFSRQLFNLPKDKKIILFGAANATSNPRKGFAQLREALSLLSKNDLLLAVFGSGDSSLDFGLPVRYFGNLKDDYSLAALYSSADAMVVPSLQDNLPNTVLESMACGTPVVGFNVGGIPDLIDHRVNGYLAKPGDPKDLAQGIAWVIDNGQSLGSNSRKKIEVEFSLKGQANRYVELYDQILKK
ncbi:MAG: glycosyltransferase, partial [Patescibacteria group bacterium]